MRKTRRRWVLLAPMALVALTLTACGDDDDTEAADTTTTEAGAGSEAGDTISVEETEYAYVVDGTAAEGAVTFDVSNTGEEYHMMAVAKMRDGVTLDQVRETLAGAFAGEGEGGGDGEEPTDDTTDDTADDMTDDSTDTTEGDAAGTLGELELISAQESTTTTSPSTTEDTTTDTSTDDTGGEGEGGEGEGGDGEGEDPFAALFEGELGAPGHIMAPGEGFTLTTEMDPGEYAIMCFLTTPDGAEDHLSNGMINSFTVEEADEPTPMPEADTEVTVSDGSVDTPTEMSSGEVLDVTLSGSEHEWMYVRLLDEDATIEDVDAYFARYDEEPLPTRDLLEANDAPAVIDLFIFSSEGEQRFVVERELDAGTYYIGCGLDEGDEGNPEGRDHVETEITKVTVS